MLVWLNGPFGGGKTQTAHALQRRLPGSVVCDPEHVGFGLHRMTPPALRGDFQDLPAWRQGVYEVLRDVAVRHPGDVLVPMTLVEPGYVEEVIGRLRRDGHAVTHVALLAEPATVRRRLRERAYGRLGARLVRGGGVPRRETFAEASLERCLQQLRRPGFAEQVWTDDLTLDEVVEAVAALAGLTLVPQQGGRLRERLQQTSVTLRHVRWR